MPDYQAPIAQHYTAGCGACGTGTGTGGGLTTAEVLALIPDDVDTVHHQGVHADIPAANAATTWPVPAGETFLALSADGQLLHAHDGDTEFRSVCDCPAFETIETTVDVATAQDKTTYRVPAGASAVITPDPSLPVGSVIRVYSVDANSTTFNAPVVSDGSTFPTLDPANSSTGLVHNFDDDFVEYELQDDGQWSNTPLSNWGSIIGGGGGGSSTGTVVYQTGDTLGYDVVLPDGSTLASGTPVPAGVIVINEENLDGTLATQASFTVSGPSATTTTNVYVEGDVLTYDIVLPDGTTLTAGSPVPANLAYVNEETAAGGLAVQHIIELPTPTGGTGAQVTTETYSTGDVLTYDATLPDGTTLTAGTPVPGDVLFINQENLDGTLNSQEAVDLTQPTFTTTVTSVYEEGDTLTYDVTLPDGSTLTAGTAVPANVLFINEENTDGTLGTQHAVELPAQTPGATTSTATYTAGDTIGYDVVLPDGSTLTAGTPVPADVLFINEENLDGTLASQQPVDLTHPTVTFTTTNVHVQGDVLAYDVTLPDGSTLTAGTAVPANVVYVNEENADGSLNVQHIIELPAATGGAGAQVTTETYVEGDTLAYNTVLPDGSTLAAGTPVPADVLFINQENLDGTLNSQQVIDLTHPTVTSTTTNTYVEGDTLAYDVTLPDGSTLTAGTAVPAGVVYVNEENADGTLNAEHLVELPATGSTVNTVTYATGDTIGYDTVLPDGSTLTTGTPVPADTLFINIENLDGTLNSQQAVDLTNPTVTFTTTNVYVEGDTLAYDVVLPDGSTLSASTVIPANLVYVNEENADGTLNAQHVVELPAPDGVGAQVTTETYAEGDTIGYDVTLPDGTTLTAGTPVPADVLFINQENLDGTLVSQQAIDLTHPTVTLTTTAVYLEGDTLGYDVTLPDGSTLTAGTAVPADTVIVNEENDDGTLAGSNVFELPTVNITVVYNPGDTLAYDVTLADGSTLTAGDPVPDGQVFINEETPTGTLAAQKVVEIPGCCLITNLLEDPATGDPVAVAIDTTTGDTSYYDANGQEWAGTPSTLVIPGINDSISSITDNNDGSFIHNPGDGSSPSPIPVANLLDDLPVNVNTDLPANTRILGFDGEWYDLPDAPCSVTVGVLTGTPNGVFTDSCSIETMPAGGDPETGYPASNFPEGWRQMFSGGITGTETWIVQNDTNNSPQWNQIA